MTAEKIGIGVAGFGGFGLFACQLFAQHPDIRLVGMASTHREAAYAAAKRFGIPEPVELEELVTWPQVDLVYIATPPFLHHSQGLMALRAGKHVLCEKPLALTLGEADELVAVARERDLLLIADLMQRYNPIYDKIKALIDTQLLGALLHGYFENYASDEGLPVEHWFWDRTRSGGIFIEHGVHFFDLFQGWLGEGCVESAQVSRRPGSEIEDQVQCVVRFGDVLINFYHGFTQPARMDRQEMRLVFERGDVTLYEWVPTRVRIHAVVDEEQMRRLMDLFPGGRLDITHVYATKDRQAHGRHKAIDVHQMIEIRYGEWQNKMHVYGDLLRALLSDQIAWMRHRNHPRRLTEVNSRESLAMACEADRLARRD